MEQEARSALVSALNKLYSKDTAEILEGADTATTIMRENQAIWEDMIVGSIKTDEADEYTAFSSSIWERVSKKEYVTFLTGSDKAKQAHIVDTLDNLYDDLSEWEQKFVESIAEKLAKNFRLSEKQVDKLNDIYRDTCL